ncbi:MAG: hypothetical protein K9W44_03215 [Candidatus Lokiarchaeota archaeon]|nr:hypothetical protein [Candidatus Harpocratesius repetitus]
MSTNLQENPSVGADIGQITPNQINPQLLLDIAEVIDHVISQKCLQNEMVFHTRSSFCLYVVCKF